MIGWLRESSRFALSSFTRYDSDNEALVRLSICELEDDCY
jgi:hypothetical protein